jgi:hypothetical protein
MDRLKRSANEKFPFERELALYLLFIVSIWPNDCDRLLTAARIYSGAINLNDATVTRKLKVYYDRDVFVSHDVFSKSRLRQFNRMFFETIGGPFSLLFTPSIPEFQGMVRRRLDELLIVHDVIKFMLGASVVTSKLNSANIAFHAVAQNFFARKNGYGVRAGPKHKRSKRGVTTVHSAREKWKRAPETILLSFVMTQILAVQRFSPATPYFFTHLSRIVRSSPEIDDLLGIIQASIKRSAHIQNGSITKWAHFPMPKAGSALIGGALRFSEAQIKRALELSDDVLKRPLSKEEKDRIISGNSNLEFGTIEFVSPDR